MLIALRLILLLIFHEHIWHNLRSQVMGQNANGQLNWKIL